MGENIKHLEGLRDSMELNITDKGGGVKLLISYKSHAALFLIPSDYRCSRAVPCTYSVPRVYWPCCLPFGVTAAYGKPHMLSAFQFI